MQWNGKDIVTFGDVMDAIQAITTKEEAQNFLAAYAPTKDAGMDGAKIDIGYMSGYFDHAEQVRIQQLFDVSHPIFGPA